MPARLLDSSDHQAHLQLVMSKSPRRTAAGTQGAPASAIPNGVRLAPDCANGRRLAPTRRLHPGYGFSNFKQTYQRHCEPTGRANARPMTGSAKQSSFLPSATKER
jgi:hypothetical protein